MLGRLIVVLSFIFYSMNSNSQQLQLYCEYDFPMQFLEKDELSGFAIDLVREIQRRVNNTDEINIVPWARGLNKVEHEKNAMLFSMARTLEREDQYQWIGPIATVSYGLYVKSNSTLKLQSIEDAKKLASIGVYRKDILDTTLTQMGFANLDHASSNESSFKKLMLGRVEVYADAQMGVENVAKISGYKRSDVKLALNLFKNSLYIVASKSTSPEIVARWNQALEDMKKDQTFQKIHKRYNSKLEPM